MVEKSENQLKEVCNFAEGTTIEGNIVAQSNIRLDGNIEGNIKCSGRIVLSKTASVNGDIICETIISEGIINGNINAKDKIHLLSSAKLNGDITYKSLQIDSGAIFNGKASIL